MRRGSTGLPNTGAGGKQEGASNAAPDMASLGISPFLSKTYNLVDDPLTDHIVSWSAGGQSFTVWQPAVLERDLLSQHFKHNNIASFIRQLNNYGFRKVNPDRYEFASPGFIKGKRELLATLQRADAHRRHKRPAEEPGAEQVHDLVESLKTDKAYLVDEVEQLRKENVNAKDKLRDLESRLERTEQLQGWMVAFLQQQLPSITGQNGPSGFLPSRKRRQLLLGAPDARLESTGNANNIQHLLSQYQLSQQPQHFGQRYPQYPNNQPSSQPQVSMAAEVSSDNVNITTKGAQMSPQLSPTLTPHMSPNASCRSSSMSAFVPPMRQAHGTEDSEAVSGVTPFAEVSWSPSAVKIEDAQTGPSGANIEPFPPLELSMSLGFLNSLDMDKLVQDMQLADNADTESAISTGRNKK
uniref:HSF-type DNA-binding domain-containing protein n=1 Tax=Pyramimonas obovata TaxID=1411642 RepID=A0A7S0RNT8_9CHLO|mmetsp:Transcript_39022/g.84903  ORF Transcript_39022/g.84903 Transcript_39022/m.84903 type:complete len:411 (+) Transcript_39022:396-1628(+)|eukprot:CAMPEP_0118920912 /NCGR_PEP_ID=MMETSP1169-20130426/339_1 /TAXON_ID=36882 /ORGANISM="Pyramimonas obovata, Strain CCMP722" /LENGTH=410 /DNA_ID=CAMNT_0006861533 /DNA_START=371 /DNA_END=1603 /DNA_ORIENTATION=+